MSEVILLTNVRLSFPHLAEPQRQKNETTGQERISYNCELIMPQDHPGFVAFMNAVNTGATAKWGKDAPAVLQMVWADRKKRCMGQGNEKVNSKTFKPYDGYEGNMYITAGRDTQPQIIDANGAPVDPLNTMACQMIARKMYGGCYVNVAIKPWFQENKHGRGVRCDLIAVQFFADGQPFGEGAVDVTGMFGATPAAAAPAAPAWGAVAPPAAPAFAPPAMPPAPFGAPAGLPSFLS